MGFIYILRGVHRNTKRVVYYVGSTLRSFDERFEEHRSGKATYTKHLFQLEPMAIVQTDNTHVRGLEYYFKQHRDLVYYAVGKWERVRTLDRLKEWCNDHHIEYKWKRLRGNDCY